MPRNVGIFPDSPGFGGDVKDIPRKCPGNAPHAWEMREEWETMTFSNLFLGNSWATVKNAWEIPGKNAYIKNLWVSRIVARSVTNAP